MGEISVIETPYPKTLHTVILVQQKWYNVEASVLGVSDRHI